MKLKIFKRKSFRGGGGGEREKHETCLNHSVEIRTIPNIFSAIIECLLGLKNSLITSQQEL